MKLRHILRSPSRNTKLRAFGVLTLVIVSALVVVFILGKREQKPQDSAPIITYSTDKPDESRENAEAYRWQGSAEEPKVLRIKSLGIETFVQKAGVDQNSQIAVPSNIHLAGWFSESVQPGKNGLSIIDGHVTGASADGVFKKIGTLQKGDTFEIELGSGKKLNYEVIEAVDLKVEESAAYLFSQKPDVVSQLNLITCGGDFNQSQNQYEKRIIVSAALKT